MIRAQIETTTLELVKGDITTQETDAIVNSANPTLGGGGGVDGAIHKAAGPDLLNETRRLGGCEVGDAKITGGYRLKARHIIHAVGPIYDPEDENVPRQLARVYQRSLEVAAQNQIKTIALPAISTGIYGYPREDAAPIALRTVIDFATHRQDSGINLIRFVLYDDEIYQIFASALNALVAHHPQITLLDA